MDDHDEILRTRERLHRIESTATAIDWRLKRLTEKVDEMSPQVAALARADEIADAVSARMSSQQTVRFTRWQRAGAAVVALAAVADVIARFIH